MEKCMLKPQNINFSSFTGQAKLVKDSKNNQVCLLCPKEQDSQHRNCFYLKKSTYQLRNCFDTIACQAKKFKYRDNPSVTIHALLLVKILSQILKVGNHLLLFPPVCFPNMYNVRICDFFVFSLGIQKVKKVFYSKRGSAVG